MRGVAAAAGAPLVAHLRASLARRRAAAPAACAPRVPVRACSSSLASPHCAAWRLWAPTRRATAVLAQLLADVSLPGDVVCLHGGVGTGKSYFWCAPACDSRSVRGVGRPAVGSGGGGATGTSGPGVDK